MHLEPLLQGLYKAVRDEEDMVCKEVIFALFFGNYSIIFYRMSFSSLRKSLDFVSLFLLFLNLSFIILLFSKICFKIGILTIIIDHDL